MSLTVEEFKACAEVAELFGQGSLFSGPPTFDMPRFLFFPTALQMQEMVNYVNKCVEATTERLESKFEKLGIKDATKRETMKKAVVGMIRGLPPGLFPLQPDLSEAFKLESLQNTVNFMINNSDSSSESE